MLHPLLVFHGRMCGSETGDRLTAVLSPLRLVPYYIFWGHFSRKQMWTFLRTSTPDHKGQELRAHPAFSHARSGAARGGAWREDNGCGMASVKHCVRGLPLCTFRHSYTCVLDFVCFSRPFPPSSRQDMTGLLIDSCNNIVFKGVDESEIPTGRISPPISGDLAASAVITGDSSGIVLQNLYIDSGPGE